MYSPQTQYDAEVTAGRPDQLEEAQMQVLGVTYDPDQDSSEAVAGMETHEEQAQQAMSRRDSTHKYKDTMVREPTAAACLNSSKA